MTSPRDLGHAIATDSGDSCWPTEHLGTCNRITAAIERARADGLAVGFRAARGDGGDSAAALRSLGVSEAAYVAAVEELTKGMRG